MIPKPLVPVGDRPILEHILHALNRAGVGQIDLCVSHLGELIEVYLTHAALPEDLDLEFHWEDAPLGTAGALKIIPDLTGTFIVMNGDVLTNLDYDRLVDFHLEREAAVTIAMTAKRVQIDLGVIDHGNGYVNGYLEKPTLDYHVSMGIYVYDQRALRYLPEGACQFPELVTRLLDAGESVAAYLSDADWFDIGTVEEYERASRTIEAEPERFGMSSEPRISSNHRRIVTRQTTP